MLKITRERTGHTQQQFAEALRMDTTSVQGWESGRRPLTAISVGKLREVRRTLLRMGADPGLLVLLGEATDADTLISYALSGRSGSDLHEHPLAGWVVNRDTTHMIAWSLTGKAPAAFPPSTSTKTRRRGPVADAPLLGADERIALFAHLRWAAELGHRAGDAGALLRRQALYLCSYDEAPDTASWLADMRRHLAAPTRGRWTPHWADYRSVAAGMTRHGNLDGIHAFLSYGMDDIGETANLNYWAYWLGLDPLPRADDSFMVARSNSWDRLALLRRLTDRLQPHLGCIDLNVRSVWSLIGSRPGLLAADPALNTALGQRVCDLLDSDVVSRRSRADLESVHYGLRLHRV
ncbi:helix-turn-helix domain-containing protein [Peterkaempfera bronchialis]|uniref:helix-turn-helix domain-containing protein n=1 Tax=Peterkaempfera bronchialis TaxID=2126346 RepID=UPI000DBBCA20|nr:helix-turn-helix domain-containing protein [Peterkaempfera bronchialis]